ncbi:hypothetical protein VPNG_06822 [Cytospora leucostoma]|uniref:Infection structure specific protein n=1 Tax=Cytospora leucostoma TaxID=1230097 RepID=A0A423WVU6_9PEZI|nr:hypothetical protein VPNG_06822 [Cytospora leucostoma]
MYFIIALFLALATSTVADTPTALPHQLLVNSITATTVTTTKTATVTKNVTHDPILTSLYSSINSEAPTKPPEISAWYASVVDHSAYDPCDIPSSAIPTSLSSAYAGYESSATKWYSDLAAGLGSLQSVDAQDVDNDYSIWISFLGCDAHKTFFSSVFYAAASATATTTSATSTGRGTDKDSRSSVSGGSSTWKDGILGAALIGMLGFVALL